MYLKPVFIIVLSLFIISNSFAQESNLNPDVYKKIDLTNKVVNSEEYTPQGVYDVAGLTAEKKSAGISLLLSLVLPGAGHYYLDRMDVGQYFMLADGISWLGFAGVNIYGNYLRDNAETFATDHAGVNREGKDDDYYTNIGNYISIYEYNNAKLSTGEYNKVYYDVDAYYWNWDTQDNFIRYESQKEESERVKNTSVIFVSALIVNRVTSALSALLLTNAHNSALSNIRINSEVTKNFKNEIDGLQLNFVKQF